MKTKKIALTFDDGPNLKTSIEVLDILKKYDAKGTFFLMGKNIDDSTKQAMIRADEEGHEIANHSFNHLDMRQISAEEIKEEVQKTTALIVDIIGKEPKYFRPPYIAVNDTMYENIDLPFICGYAVGDSNAETTAENRAKDVINGARDGAIVILHDFFGNSKTVTALDTIIPSLQQEGYEFLTLSELFDACSVVPKAEKGIIYTYLL